MFYLGGSFLEKKPTLRQKKKQSIKKSKEPIRLIFGQIGKRAGREKDGRPVVPRTAKKKQDKNKKTIKKKERAKDKAG